MVWGFVRAYVDAAAGMPEHGLVVNHSIKVKVQNRLRLGSIPAKAWT